MEADVSAILKTPPARQDSGAPIGRSREGRPIHAHRYGTGAAAVSLLGGCHADEPVGPRLLRHFVAWLGELERSAPGHPLLRDYQWWIVPHINPDGEARNAEWAEDPDPDGYELGSYLAGRVRELPGDDIEFGFPTALAETSEQTDGTRGPPDPSPPAAPLRPENRAVFDWWSEADRPFVLHASLHGMGFAAGPWFLVESVWRGRLDGFTQACRARTHELGYVLHDVERRGEKGFVRIERGFTTRPDSRAMRAHFIGLDDPDTASRFRPSSMEAIRSLGHDTLTLVSEMPLFLTPGVGETLGPPDPMALVWKDRIARWEAEVSGPGDRDKVSGDAYEAGLRPMPLPDQMELQWTMIRAGLDAVARQ